MKFGVRGYLKDFSLVVEVIGIRISGAASLSGAFCVGCSLCVKIGFMIGPYIVEQNSCTDLGYHLNGCQ